MSYDRVDDPRVTGTHYIHPVALHQPPPHPPPPRITKKGHITKGDRLAAVEHKADHAPDHTDLNNIITTLNTLIDVVNQLTHLVEIHLDNLQEIP